MSMYKLTIAIPTVVGREDLFNELYTHLKYQAEWNPVEVIYLKDNKEISIGAKRQKLLDMAKGEYVVFIDDDDWVVDSYVQDILEAIEQKPDSIGFDILCSGTEGTLASASNKWQDWSDNKGGYDYVRTPYQKTPIKIEIAREIGYKDIRFGEDYDYSKRLKQSGLIKSEVYIPKILYHYRYQEEDVVKKYGLKN